jgi:hypothetical protein
MEPFWIDCEYDRDNASDGVSRYGTYVRQAAFEPWTDDDKAVELAVFAWQTATGPVMAPGYVRKHRRILSARLERSGWDGKLLACVDLLIPQPSSLRLPATDGEGRASYWLDWPVEPRTLFGGGNWYEPGGEELAGGPYLLATASLRFAVPSGDLPEPHLDGAGVATCQRSVAVVVRELNRITGPVLACIEEG